MCSKVELTWRGLPVWGLSAIRDSGHVLGSERNWRVDWRLLVVLVDDMLEV